MTPIASSEDPIPVRIGSYRQFAAHGHDQLGHLISDSKRQCAMNMVNLILEKDKFFRLEFAGGYGSVRTDAIVMTMDEYYNLMSEQFRKGVSHAMGYMPKAMP